MIEREYGYGLLTGWKIPMWSRRQLLVDGFKQEGFSKFAPCKRTATQGLKDALEDTHRGAVFLIPALKNNDGYEVRQVVPITDTENRVDRLFSVTIDANNAMTFYPGAPANIQAIVDSFNEHRGLVRTAEVTACLVHLIKHLGGTHFPVGRGAYFIPPATLETWRKIAAVVESASFKNPSQVHLAKLVIDPDSIKAIIAGLTGEIEQRLNEIEGEIKSGKLKKKALIARQGEALALEEKIKEYEALLGIGLESLRSSVDRTEESIMRATILASAARETSNAA